VFYLIEKIAYQITRKPKLVVLIALLLLIPSFIGYIATRVNYDILSYLPGDLDSVKGSKILEEPFQMAATTMLVIEDMPPAYADRLQNEIEDIPGVNSVTWLSGIVGIQVPTDMLPEDIRDIFYSDNATMMIVQYDMPGGSNETMNAIDQIRSICNKHCFLAGLSTVTKDIKELILSEFPIYVLLAVVATYVAMTLTISSWILPFAILAGIGLAVIYNFGTNIILGEVSYVTQAIAAVLQLGVTMDYSIFLYHRYEEECKRYADKRDAMAKAVVAAYTAVFSSSFTTVAGFLALCFMRLLLGRDIGLVMAKGVVLGLVVVVFVLPAILLLSDNLIHKYQHRTIRLDLSRPNAFIAKHSKLFVVLFLLLLVPAYYAQKHAEVYYKLDQTLPRDLPSIVANQKLKDEFGMTSVHFIVMKDGLPYNQMHQLDNQLENVTGVTSVVSYSKLAGHGIPDFFIPDDLRKMLKQEGMQLIMVNSKYSAATDDAKNQLEEIKKIVKSYDPQACVTGEIAMTADLVDLTAIDIQVTNVTSMIAVLIIIAVSFKSLSIPLLLVAAIELAVFLNQGTQFFLEEAMPFVAPTVIGCVQLGATVDYSILLATRFQEEIRNGHDRKEAILIAANTSDTSIITSSLVLLCSTLSVGLISSIGIISSLCNMLARGSVISAVISMFITPAVLVTFEPVIAKTTLWWRNAKPQKQSQKQLPAPSAVAEAVTESAPFGRKLFQRLNLSPKAKILRHRKRRHTERIAKKNAQVEVAAREESRNHFDS